MSTKGSRRLCAQLMDRSKNLQPLPAIRQCIHGSLEVSTPTEPSFLPPELTKGTRRQAHTIVRGFPSTSSCRKGHVQERPSCLSGRAGAPISPRCPVLASLSTLAEASSSSLATGFDSFNLKYTCSQIILKEMETFHEKVVIRGAPEGLSQPSVCLQLGP